ncbi:MAG: hypothetical protein ABIC57_01225 [bacterium]
MSQEKNGNIRFRVEKLEKEIAKIQSFLKGKTLARFKYVKSNYKYIKDIYARLEDMKKEIEKIKKVINIENNNINTSDVNG